MIIYKALINLVFLVLILIFLILVCLYLTNQISEAFVTPAVSPPINVKKPVQVFKDAIKTGNFTSVIYVNRGFMQFKAITDNKAISCSEAKRNVTIVEVSRPANETTRASFKFFREPNDPENTFKVQVLGFVNYVGNAYLAPSYCGYMTITHLLAKAAVFTLPPPQSDTFYLQYTTQQNNKPETRQVYISAYSKYIIDTKSTLKKWNDDRSLVFYVVNKPIGVARVAPPELSGGGSGPSGTGDTNVLSDPAYIAFTWAPVYESDNQPLAKNGYIRFNSLLQIRPDMTLSETEALKAFMINHAKKVEASEAIQDALRNHYRLTERGNPFHGFVINLIQHHRNLFDSVRATRPIPNLFKSALDSIASNYENMAPIHGYDYTDSACGSAPAGEFTTKSVGNLEGCIEKCQQTTKPRCYGISFDTESNSEDKETKSCNLFHASFKAGGNSSITRFYQNPAEKLCFTSNVHPYILNCANDTTFKVMLTLRHKANVQFTHSCTGETFSTMKEHVSMMFLNDEVLFTPKSNYLVVRIISGTHEVIDGRSVYTFTNTGKVFKYNKVQLIGLSQKITFGIDDDQGTIRFRVRTVDDKNVYGAIGTSMPDDVKTLRNATFKSIEERKKSIKDAVMSLIMYLRTSSISELNQTFLARTNEAFTLNWLKGPKAGSTTSTFNPYTLDLDDEFQEYLWWTRLKNGDIVTAVNNKDPINARLEDLYSNSFR